MADGRFVSKSIAQSEQLGRVSLEADYLFGRCIPHLDREGRMIGNPELVRSMVCPLRRELDADRVGKLIAELVQAELVVWYEANGRQCLFFPGFHRHQRGLRKRREAVSRLPSPKEKGAKQIDLLSTGVAGSTPADAGPTPPEVEVEVEGKLKEKGSRSEVKSSAPPNWVASFCEAWQDRFQGIAPGGRIGKALKPLRSKHADDVILSRWKTYLAAIEAPFASPEKFAQTFGEWDPAGTPPGITGVRAPAVRPGESTDEYLSRVRASGHV